MTSSPALTSTAATASWSELVPLWVSSACLAPTLAANSASSARASGA